MADRTASRARPRSADPDLPVLTARALNRATLARQLLLERAELSVPEALERVAGLQTQYAPSGYVGLWSRLVDFPRASLTLALEDRSAVQGTLMRSTIHTVSAADYRLFASGSRPSRRAWFLRAWSNQIPNVDLDEVASFVRTELSAGPRKRQDLEAAVISHGWPRLAWVGVATCWLDLVRVPPSGTWERRRADLYWVADEWLAGQLDRTSGQLAGRSDANDRAHGDALDRGSGDPRDRPSGSPVDPPASERQTGGPPIEEAGLELLLRRYLEGFGPASVKEAAGWAGVPVAPVAAAAKRLDGRLGLRRFRDESGTEMIDLPGAPLPNPETPAPVRFLGTWETVLLAFARRAGVLPEPFRPLVFNTRTPHSIATFLVDGRVAGSWRYEKGRVAVTPFAPLSPEVARDVQAEADALTEFHRD